MANWDKLNKELDDALSAMTDEEWSSFKQRIDNKRSLPQQDVIVFDGCLKCKNNLPENGYWCATNCIKGSKFEPSIH